MELNFTLEEIHTVAKKMLPIIDTHRVIAFHGQMGAGKTTLIKAFCKAMGVQDVISSPTYSLINSYKTPNNTAIFHIDLYRIKDEEEAINAGIEDCLYSTHICLIEWPDKIENLLPENTLHLTLTIQPDRSRKICF